MTIPQNEVASKGFSAGIRLWLVFLLIFYWLGYPAWLSITFGLLMGGCGGLIGSWWETKEDAAKAEAAPENQSLEDIADDRQRQSRYYARRRRAKKKQPGSFTMPPMLDRLAFWRSR
jgi:hypothetical protein